MFKVGDIVEASGMKGVVVEINQEEVFPVFVYFNETQENEVFTLDGKFFSEHLHPTLKLIERPKKKVKKTIEKWIIVYNSGVFNEVYNSEEQAKESAFDEQHQIVKLTGEFEGEE